MNGPRTAAQPLAAGCNARLHTLSASRRSAEAVRYGADACARGWTKRQLQFQNG